MVPLTTLAGSLLLARPSKHFIFMFPRDQLILRIIKDRAVVEKLYTSDTKAWFRYIDEKRDGGPQDPRVAVLEITAVEIRHFHQEKTAIGTAVDVISSTLSGSMATPGSIRTITGEEIASAWAGGNLKEP
jgi:hypothetical protein